MKKSTRKLLIWLAVIIGFLLFAYSGAYLLAPGSYVYSEDYELHAAESEVIAAVKQFKRQHPNMTVPYTTINGSPSESLTRSEGRNNNSYWYAFYFYFPKENEVYLTLTRPSDNGTTMFSLVSVNKTLDLPHWKEVNKDFSKEENLRIKAQFEAILKHLKIKYSDKGNSMSLW
jgi:hypothetical protein